MLHQIYLLLKKTCTQFIILEGRDKLTKFFIYLFKFIDATKSIYNRKPTYKFERIGRKHLLS